MVLDCQSNLIHWSWKKIALGQYNIFYVIYVMTQSQFYAFINYLWLHFLDQLNLWCLGASVLINFVICRGWDQFEANEALFGVKSTFDEDLYTTKLDRGPQMRELEREALRIAREIEGEDTKDLHLAEVRLPGWISFIFLVSSLLFIKASLLVSFYLTSFLIIGKRNPPWWKLWHWWRNQILISF